MNNKIIVLLSIFVLIASCGVVCADEYLSNDTGVVEKQSGDNCWAYATTDVVEANYHHQTGEWIDLDEAPITEAHVNKTGREGATVKEVRETMASMTINNYTVELVKVNNSVDAIKSAITEYGAVFGYINANNVYLTNYNSTVYQIFYNASEIPNHAIVIVGWTDTHYIIKNSWGTNNNCGLGLVEFSNPSINYISTLYTVKVNVPVNSTLGSKSTIKTTTTTPTKTTTTKTTTVKKVVTKTAKKTVKVTAKTLKKALKTSKAKKAIKAFKKTHKVTKITYTFKKGKLTIKFTYKL